MTRRQTKPSTTAHDLHSTKAAQSVAPTLDPIAKALIVDGNSESAAIIAAALRGRDWHVQITGTIADARRQLRDLEPHVVLVDLWLPDGSGIIFVRELANRSDIGIVVVSACSDVVDRVVGLELGADHYVTKPFSLRDLTARLRALKRRILQQRALSSPACQRDCRNSGRCQTTAPRAVGRQSNAEDTPPWPSLNPDHGRVE